MKIVFSLFALCYSTTLAAEILLRHSTIDVSPLIESSRVRLTSHPNPIPESVEHSQHAANLLSMDAGQPVRMPIDDRDADRQWLVHVKSPITARIKSNVNAHIAPYSLSSIYLPHDTFLLVAPRDVAERIHDAPGVLYVAEFAPVFKHDPASNNHVLSNIDAKHTERREKLHASAASGRAPELASLAFSRVKLHVSLASSSNSRAVNEATARGWITELASEFGIHDLEFVYASVNQNFVILSTGKDTAHNAIRNLASFHEVHWVEVSPNMETFNKHTHAVVQAGSANYTDTTIWDRDLRGEGQVVGIADTGIDVDMCFFHDDDEAIAYNSVNMNHRKIVTYTSFSGDQTDDVDGHGTHTSGTVAGDVLDVPFPGSSDDDLAVLREYNGMANLARLAFYDLGNGDDFDVPDDIYEALYLASYEQTGTRVHSHSWGASSPYGALSLLTDRFVHDYPDFLPVYAAGNDGDSGLFTVATPSLSKNALAVGATTNSAESFFVQGLAVGIEVVEPTAAATTLRFVPSDFGPSLFATEFETAFQNVGAAVASPYNACSSLTNSAALNGNVVLMQRGTCSFVDKVRQCQSAGGSLCIVVNTDDEHLTMGGTLNAGEVVPPSGLVTMTDGQILLDNINALVLTAPRSVAVGEFQKDLLTSFSSRGPAGDGRLKPDIVAPGQFVQSARSDGNPNSFNCYGESSLYPLQGTSMATPLAAAGVAIVREYFVKGFFPSGVETAADSVMPSAALLKAVMINSGQPIQSFTETDPILELTPPSIYQGFGQMQMDKVLKFDDSPHSLFLSQDNSVAPLASNAYCFDITSFDVPFKVTLVWTDPEPSESSLRILINNLDLTVAHVDSSELYMGNNIQFTDTDGTLFTRHDELNNVEQVWIEPGEEVNQPSVDSLVDPQLGVYVIRVIGFGVPVGDSQTYSLVVTGDFNQSSSGSCDAFPDSNICPKDCSGNGECVEGRCGCASGYSSADCSQEATTLEFDAQRYEGALQQAGWEFFRFEVDPTSEALFGGDNEDFVVKIFSTRTGGRGDPDLYVAINTWPTLENYAYANNECDPCGATTHVTDIDPADLVNSVGLDDVTQVTEPDTNSTSLAAENTVTLVVGMYGYCCEDSEFSIRVDVGLPESWSSPEDTESNEESLSSSVTGDDTTGLAPFVIAVIAILSVLCVCGFGYFVYRKRDSVRARWQQRSDAARGRSSILESGELSEHE